MLPTRICLLCLFTAVSACAGDTIRGPSAPVTPPGPNLFEISLHDPRQVSVLAVGRDGPVMLSPRDGPAGATYLPDAVFPVTAIDCRGGRLLRGDDGSIALERVKCPARDEGWTRQSLYGGRTLVHVDGSIEPQAFKWENDELVWQTVLSRSWCVRPNEGRNRCSKWDEEPIVAVELRTPRANVRKLLPYAPPPPE